MDEAEHHSPPIPKGFQIYEEWIEVAGLAHRKRDASRFVQGKNKELDWQRDPSNPHDANAIKLVGVYKGFFGSKRVMLGYVPKKVAKTIVEGNLWGSVRPRLSKTYLGSGGFVEIIFQIIGPKDRIGDYKRSTPNIGREHYTEEVETVKQLKREKRHDEAITLLLQLIAETEAETKAEGEGWGVAPWYYEQLAIIYRKERRYDDEIAILERYAEQQKGPGSGRDKLASRLEKARKRRGK